MILFAFCRNKFYHPVVLINHVVMMNGVCFLNYMQYMDQQQPCKSVVSNNGNQIVDSCDQRTGSNCRIDFDLVKEHRDQCADHAGDHHGYHQGKSNAAGDQECMSHRIIF